MSYDILAAASILHPVILAASGGGTPVLDIVAWIGIPLFLALCSAIFVGVKASVKVGQYLANSEVSQTSIAKSNNEINDKLTDFIEKTDKRLGEHDQKIAVLDFAMEHMQQENGAGKVLRPRRRNEGAE